MKLINVAVRKRDQTNRVTIDMTVYELAELLRDLRNRSVHSERTQELIALLEGAYDDFEEFK